MTIIGATLTFAMFLLVYGLLYSSPLLVFVWLMRHRITPVSSAALVSLGLGVAAAYTLYRVEWFDYSGRGLPAARIMRGYAVWILPYFVLG